MKSDGHRLYLYHQDVYHHLKSLIAKYPFLNNGSIFSSRTSFSRLDFIKVESSLYATLLTSSTRSSSNLPEIYAYFLPSGFTSLVKSPIRLYKWSRLSLANSIAPSIFSSGSISASASIAKNLLSSPANETVIFNSEVASCSFVGHKT